MSCVGTAPGSFWRCSVLLVHRIFESERRSGRIEVRRRGLIHDDRFSAEPSIVLELSQHEGGNIGTGDCSHSTDGAVVSASPGAARWPVGEQSHAYDDPFKIGRREPAFHCFLVSDFAPQYQAEEQLARKPTDLRPCIAGPERRNRDDPAHPMLFHRPHDISNCSGTDPCAASPRSPSKGAQHGIVSGKGVSYGVGIGSVARHDCESWPDCYRSRVTSEGRHVMPSCQRLGNEVLSGTAGGTEDNESHGWNPILELSRRASTFVIRINVRLAC